MENTFGLDELIACSLWLIFPLYLLLAGRGKPSRIKPAKITKIVPVNSMDELEQAIADVYTTPFGNVGQHIKYKGTDKLRKEIQEMDDPVKRMIPLHVLDHPRQRIEPGYTRDDVRMEKTVDGETVVYRSPK